MPSSTNIDTTEYAVNYPIQPIPTDVPESQQPLVPTRSQIERKRYATSVDERNFLTVYEYMVNGQWVIWDYYTGYVHLTGLWKAIGNSKADIVKLVDNSPHLEPVIRRVRGGFLKIQGTWLPFGVAKTLASRTCYHIRYALVPVFGTDFPGSCLTPEQPGFGQLQLQSTTAAAEQASARRRARRNSSARRKSDTPQQPHHHHQHRVSKSVSLNGGVGHPYSRSSDRRRNTHSGVGTGRRGSLPALVMDENALYDSSESDDFDDDLDNDFAYTQKKLSQFSLPPPPLPDKINLADTGIVESPTEFAEVLQATRSLQRISAGSAGRRWSTSNLDLGGGFECGGRLWRWDGNQRLRVIGYTSPRSNHQVPRKIVHDNENTPQDDNNNGNSGNHHISPPPSSHRAMDINGLLS